MARSIRTGTAVAILVTALNAGARASAQCVGDCRDQGDVSISDLIIGVNIALGLQPPDACPAFQDEDGEVTIAQLIKGVNNALNGCPPELTPTATVSGPDTPTATNTQLPTGTDTPPVQATATDTPSVQATATATPTGEVSTATVTHTGVATATATQMSGNTATHTATDAATATHTAVASTATHTAAASTATHTAAEFTATHTATAESTATRTATVEPTATRTATAGSTATVTGTPVSTATATEPPTPSSTPTITATASVTPTATSTRTPTETPVPVGKLFAGHAPIMAVGLGSLHSAIAAFAAQINTPPAGLSVDSGSPAGVPTPGVACEKTCTEMGTGENKTIGVLLAADGCTVTGTDGGPARFNGRITLESAPSSISACDPLAFSSAMYQIGHLEGVSTVPLDVTYENATMDTSRRFMVVLQGTLSMTGETPATCLIDTLNMTLLGGIRTRLAEGAGSLTIDTSFFDTSVRADAFVFNADCVPLSYRLTFSGSVGFTASMEGPAIAGSQGENIIASFNAEFDDFFFRQAANAGQLSNELNGVPSSACFGAEFLAETDAPLVTAADALCPTSGQVTLGSRFGPATFVYNAGAVSVNEGGDETMFPSCLAEELITCVPQ